MKTIKKFRTKAIAMCLIIFIVFFNFSNLYVQARDSDELNIDEFESAISKKEQEVYDQLVEEIVLNNGKRIYAETINIDSTKSDNNIYGKTGTFKRYLVIYAIRKEKLTKEDLAKETSKREINFEYLEKEKEKIISDLYQIAYYVSKDVFKDGSNTTLMDNHINKDGATNIRYDSNRNIDDYTYYRKASNSDKRFSFVFGVIQANKYVKENEEIENEIKNLEDSNEIYSFDEFKKAFEEKYGKANSKSTYSEIVKFKDNIKTYLSNPNSLEISETNTNVEGDGTAELTQADLNAIIKGYEIDEQENKTEFLEKVGNAIVKFLTSVIDEFLNIFQNMVFPYSPVAVSSRVAKDNNDLDEYVEEKYGDEYSAIFMYQVDRTGENDRIKNVIKTYYENKYGNVKETLQQTGTSYITNSGVFGTSDVSTGTSNYKNQVNSTNKNEYVNSKLTKEGYIEYFESLGSEEGKKIANYIKATDIKDGVTPNLPYAKLTDKTRGPIPFIYLTPDAVFSNNIPMLDVHFMTYTNRTEDPFIKYNLLTSKYIKMTAAADLTGGSNSTTALSSDENRRYNLVSQYEYQASEGTLYTNDKSSQLIGASILDGDLLGFDFEDGRTVAIEDFEDRDLVDINEDINSKLEAFEYYKILKPELAKEIEKSNLEIEDATQRVNEGKEALKNLDDAKEAAIEDEVANILKEGKIPDKYGTPPQGVDNSNKEYWLKAQVQKEYDDMYKAQYENIHNSYFKDVYISPETIANSSQAVSSKNIKYIYMDLKTRFNLQALLNQFNTWYKNDRKTDIANMSKDDIQKVETTISKIKKENDEKLRRQGNIIDQLGNIINKWFVGLRNVSISLLLVVLVYIAIKIVISTTAQKKSDYKKALLNWIISVAILFILPFIMILISTVCDALINMIGSGYSIFDAANGYYGDPVFNNIRMHLSYNILTYHISEALGYQLLYLAAIILTVFVFFQYLMRFLNLLFMTLISPLISLTYAVDKYGDGQAQAFSAWLNEYSFNYLIQPIQLLAYRALLGLASGIASQNLIYALLAIYFVYKVPGYIKDIFKVRQTTDTDKIVSDGIKIFALQSMNMISQTIAMQKASNPKIKMKNPADAKAVLKATGEGLKEAYLDSTVTPNELKDLEPTFRTKATKRLDKELKDRNESKYDYTPKEYLEMIDVYQEEERDRFLNSQEEQEEFKRKQKIKNKINKGWKKGADLGIGTLKFTVAGIGSAVYTGMVLGRDSLNEGKGDNLMPAIAEGMAMNSSFKQLAGIGIDVVKSALDFATGGVAATMNVYREQVYAPTAQLNLDGISNNQVENAKALNSNVIRQKSKEEWKKDPTLLKYVDTNSPNLTQEQRDEKIEQLAQLREEDKDRGITKLSIAQNLMENDDKLTKEAALYLADNPKERNQYKVSHAKDNVDYKQLEEKAKLKDTQTSQIVSATIGQISPKGPSEKTEILSSSNKSNEEELNNNGNERLNTQSNKGIHKKGSSNDEITNVFNAINAQGNNEEVSNEQGKKSGNANKTGNGKVKIRLEDSENKKTKPTEEKYPKKKKSKSNRNKKKKGNKK